MNMKNYLLIFALFMVLFCCVSTISATTDDVMGNAVFDVDSSDDLISIGEIGLSDDLSSNYADEQAICVDENDSAFIAYENDDSISRQSFREEIEFKNSQILGVSEEDNNVLSDKQDVQLSFENEVYELTGTSVTVKFILDNPSEVGGGANIPLDVYLDGSYVATKNYGSTSTYSSNRFKSADVSYGSHIVTVKFNGNDNYNEAEATCTLLKPLPITLDFDNSGNEAVFTLNTGTTDATGTFNVTLNGEKISEGTVTAGVGTATFNKIVDDGYYPFVISYDIAGVKSTVNKGITIGVFDTQITFEKDVYQLDGYSVYINFALVNASIIADGKDITFDVFIDNNPSSTKSYHASTDSYDSIYLTKNDVAGGIHNVTVRYNGNDNYNPSNASCKLIKPLDITVDFDNSGDKAVITLNTGTTDATGNLTVSLNNEKISEATIENGIGNAIFDKLVDSGYYPFVISYILNGTYEGMYGNINKGITIPRELNLNNNSQWGSTGFDNKNSGKTNSTRLNNVYIKWMNNETMNLTGNPLDDDYGTFEPSYSPVIDSEGNIFISDDRAVYSFNNDGELIYKATSINRNGGITLYGDQIMLSSCSINYIRLVDALTLENFAENLGYSTASRFPAVVGPDGRVYIVATWQDSDNKWITALKFNGEKFNLDTSYYKDTSVPMFGGPAPVTAMPVFVEDIMWISTNNGIHGINITSGSEIFSNTIGVSGRPVVDEANILYYLGVDNKIYALTQEGDVWNSTVTGTVGTTLAVDSENSLLYAVNGEGKLYKYTTDEGTEELVGDVGSAGQSVIIDNDNVYVSTVNGDVYAFDSENNELWTINLGSSILGQLAMDANGVIYAFTADTIYALGYRNETELIFEVEENFTTLDNITFTASINSTFDGENITFAVISDNGYENTINKTISDGQAVFNIGALKEGNYTVTASYAGNTYYNEASISQDFKVSKVTPELSVNVNNATVFENATITVTSTNCEGNVTVKVGDDYTYENVVIGEEFTLPLLPIGIYDVTVTYAADNIYTEAVNDTEQLEISKADAVIIPDVDSGFTDATVTLTFPDGAEGTVYLDVEGIGYYAVIESGVAVINVVGLEAGEEYPASVFYTGDDNYNNQTFDLTIKTEDLLDAELELTVDDTIISVSIDDGATGMIILTVGDISFVYDAQEVIVLDASAYLGNGTYDVSAIYEGDGIYSADADENKVTIPEKTLEDPELDVSVDGTDVTISLNENATGYVVVSADGKDLFFEYDGEPVVVDFSDLEPGNYTVEVTYSGDDVFASDNASAKLSVPVVELLDSELKVDIQNTTVTVSINENATGDVIITVGDISFIQDADELAPIDVSEYLTNGTYPVTVKYVGDDVFAEKVLIGGKVTVPEDPVVEPKDPNLKATAVNSTITVTVDKDATGNVLVDVDGQGYYAEIKNGKAVIDVIGLDAGTYKASVTYLGDDVFASANTTVSVTVPEDPVVEPKDPNLKATAVNSTITVTVDKDATGNVLVDVGGQGYYAAIKNGKAVINVIGLDEGKYDALVTYLGDDVFASANATVSVTVPKKEDPTPEPVDPKADIKITNETVSVNLPKDATGYVLVDVDGTGYYVPVKDGKASFDLPELAPGNHAVTVTYTGDKKYDSSSVNKTIAVVNPVETIVSENLTKIEKSPDRFVAKFSDKDGKALANTKVTFAINGGSYTRTTDANGVASFAISLPAGTYTMITTNPVTGDTKENSITVLSRFVENRDVTKYFRNATQYVLKVLGDDGKPAAAGEVVTFNINGVFYNRTVNATGHVKMNINLNPGNYVITAEYKGCKVSNNIKVLPVLTGKDLTKKFGEPGQFEATLVDGQGKAYANQKISFNINGVFYERTTNANGIAKLNINLQPGVYIITSTYGQASISNKVTVTA